MSAVTHLALKAQSRTILGNTGKKLRRTGLVPAVIYGYNIKEPINISLPYNEFEKVYRVAGNTSVVDIEIDGKKLNTLVHALQYHPVKDTYLHIDFLAVNMKKIVEAEVPLVFTGVPVPVKQDGAVLNKSIEVVTVSCLPDSIPHEIEVDLALIQTVDDTITIKDLNVPKGVEIMNDQDETVASVIFAKEDSEDVTPETVIGDPSSNASTDAE